MRSFFRACVAVIIFVFLPYLSCNSLVEHRASSLQLGTVVNITIIAPSEREAVRAANAAFKEIARIEKLLSPVIEESDVYRINAYGSSKEVEVSEETLNLLHYAKEVWQNSERAFDITFASIAHLWDFSKPSFVPPSAARVNALRSLINSKYLILNDAKRTVKFQRKQMKIGLGGIAKGYAIKRAIEVLQQHGIQNAIVEAGGDLMVIGNKRGDRWYVALAHPRAKDEVVAILQLDPSTAIATSGDYERYAMYKGVRYHHIIDPKTGFPAKKCISVSVICNDPVKADAYATACFVLGKEKAFALAQKEQFGIIIIEENMKMYASESVKEMFVIQDEDISVQWMK